MMSIAVGILLAVAGIVMLVVGSVLFVVFRIALRGFDRSLQSEIASQGREQVETLAMRISNPLVRRLVLTHLVTTGGTIAVSMVRSAIQSRMQTFMLLALAGAIVLVGAFPIAGMLR
jgi:hypothetical protein